VVAVALLLDSTRTVLHSTWHDRKLMESSFVTPDCTEDAVLRRASGGTVRLDPDFVPTALNPKIFFMIPFVVWEGRSGGV
jgi:hypothetical protein